MPPLTGEYFTMCAAIVHTFIINLITDNYKAKVKAKNLTSHQDGRMDLTDSHNRYKVVGTQSKDISRSAYKYILDNWTM